jgi:hypothetical protein
MNLLPDKKLDVDGRRNKVIFRERSIENMRDAMRWSAEDVYNSDYNGNRRRGRSSFSGTPSFTGTESIGAYIDMLDNGWQAGVDGMAELEGMTSDAADQLAFVRAPGGAFPVVPAHLAGHPNSMLMPTVQPSDNVRGVSLVIDSCFGANVRSTTILEYAREVMKLVAWLTAEKLDVAVYAVVPIKLDNKRVVYTVPVRRSGDILQPERIASILHPSFLRRAWFAMIEYEYYECFKAPDKNGMEKHIYPECQNCECGYGSVTSFNADELRQALPDAYSVVVLPKPGYGDPKKAVEEVLNVKLRRD